MFQCVHIVLKCTLICQQQFHAIRFIFLKLLQKVTAFSDIFGFIEFIETNFINLLHFQEFIETRDA